MRNRCADSKVFPLLFWVLCLPSFAASALQTANVTELNSVFTQIPPPEGDISTSSRLMFTMVTQTEMEDPALGISNQGSGCRTVAAASVVCDPSVLEEVKQAEWCSKTKVLVLEMVDGVEVTGKEMPNLLCPHYRQDIVSVERDFKVRISAEAPNDAFVFNQWHLPVVSVFDSDGEQDAWDITMGEREVIVAVIDTGVDYEHADLIANMWTNPGEIPGDGIDNDGNGFVDDIHGWDFVNNDGDPLDDQGHGTHCAGLIGAVAGNGVGVAGVSPNVRVMALKALGQNGEGFLSAIIGSVEYALQMGAHITSNSFGSPGTVNSFAFSRVINAARQEGQLYVAAAGNAGRDTDLAPEFPASHSSDIILSVAATEQRDTLAPFSNFGLQSVDLAAPGVGILSTAPGSAYAVLSGTSTSTPIVSGTAALVLSVMVRNNMPVAGQGAVVKQIIMDSADKIDRLTDVTVAGGRVNVGAAVARAVELSSGPCRPQDTTPPIRIDSGDPSSPPPLTNEPPSMDQDMSMGRKMTPIMKIDRMTPGSPVPAEESAACLKERLWIPLAAAIITALFVWIR